MKTSRIVCFVIISSFWAMLANGCNTMQGAGKDVEKAGEKIQDAAKK